MNSSYTCKFVLYYKYSSLCRSWDVDIGVDVDVDVVFDVDVDVDVDMSTLGKPV